MTYEEDRRYMEARRRGVEDGHSDNVDKQLWCSSDGFTRLGYLTGLLAAWQATGRVVTREQAGL